MLVRVGAVGSNCRELSQPLAWSAVVSILLIGRLDGVTDGKPDKGGSNRT
jgi:hypothetical protein